MIYQGKSPIKMIKAGIGGGLFTLIMNSFGGLEMLRK